MRSLSVIVNCWVRGRVGGGWEEGGRGCVKENARLELM